MNYFLLFDFGFGIFKKIKNPEPAGHIKLFTFGAIKDLLKYHNFEIEKIKGCQRDKQGFINPEEKWLKQDFKEKIIDLFKKSKLAELGILDNNKFLEIYQSFLKGNRKIWYSDIARFLTTELWIRKLIK